MPNWCENNLTINGANERLKQFLSENVKDDRELDFNFVSPSPTDETWYDWRWQNWGTKWTGDVYFVEHAQDDALTINFNTAWSPPNAWIEKASKHYPDLHFYLLYEESGCNFAGYFQAENGETAGECAELEFVDEESGEKVAYDSTKDKYVLESGKVIEDEYYIPQSFNPYA
jgi:hypothetical protein